ncbi:MAG: 16S rRNA (guanine(527)-N(7))-methyltransferase RsmG [Thermodesulfobacteriota bacterium]|nr:16S rRNA (guanine(527)-N(7))-methyltransferase RsmG [Thermodesulfobacteriota bacterium]
MDFNNQWKRILENGGREFNIRLDKAQLDLMAFHGSEMVKWNKKFNITSITDPYEIAVKHFIDSAILANYISDNSRVLDLGSGGGFPGLVLKIIKPGLDMVLADSSRKKTSFISHIIRSAGLEQVRAVHERCETLAQREDFAFSFDVAVSRAFTSLDRFMALSRPFLQTEGVIIAMKGEKGIDEATSHADRKQLNIIPYRLPYEKHKRTLICRSYSR